MAKIEHRIAFVDIAWNKYEWRQIDDESPIGFNYEHSCPDHLNFKFDKKEDGKDGGQIDDDEFVYGYAPAFKKNHTLNKNGTAVIFFFSRPPKGKLKIVGVYGGAKQIKEMFYTVDGYDDMGLALNVRGKKDYSVNFEPHLDLDDYYNGRTGQAGIKYITKEDVVTGKFLGVDKYKARNWEEDVAKRIILDAIAKCKKQDNIAKLHNVFEFVTGHDLEEEERMNAEGLIRTLPREKADKLS